MDRRNARDPGRRVKDGLAGRWRDDHGQTMAEYGVVLAVISIAVVIAFTALSGGISNAVDNATGLLP